MRVAESNYIAEKDERGKGPNEGHKRWCIEYRIQGESQAQEPDRDGRNSKMPSKRGESSTISIVESDNMLVWSLKYNGNRL